MSKILRIGDSLRNLVANLGTPRDKSSHTHYALPTMTENEATNAYRGAWLPRKIVDIPAMDATRNWRSWQAESADISLIEAEEDRLGLRSKVLETLRKARLYGGAAIYIGTGDRDPSKELNPERIQKGGIKHLNVMTRRVLTAGEIERDPESPLYGRPSHYMLHGANGQVEIHTSRLALFVGAMHPDSEMAAGPELGWGDSVLTSILTAIKNADGTAANVASLVFEAKVDVFKIPGLMEGLAEGGPYEQQLLDRLMLAATAKGINGALLMDAEEEYEQKSANFTGLTDILSMGLQIVSGAADIPMTRLLGQAPGGLNASGESDTRNYYDRIRAMQELEIEPALETLDECLIRSALGSRPDDVHFNWRSLWQASEKERADIGKVISDTIKAIEDTGLFPMEVWSETAANMLIESGVAPGLEAALASYTGPSAAEERESELEALGAQERAQQGAQGQEGEQERGLSDSKGFDPNQPRVPKGSEAGGQWTAEGGGGSSSKEGTKGEEKKVKRYGTAAVAERVRERWAELRGEYGFDGEMEDALDEIESTIATQVSDAPSFGLDEWMYEDAGARSERDIGYEVEDLFRFGAQDKTLFEGKDAVKGLLRYSGDEAEVWNQELRDGEVISVYTHEGLIEVDRLIASVKAPHNYATYRGVDAGMVKHWEPGDRILDRGFVSTSLQRSRAEKFAEVGGRKGAVMKVLVPEGAAGLPLDPINATYHKGEFEVLLPRNTTFLVRSVDRKTNTVVVEVVGGERDGPERQRRPLGDSKGFDPNQPRAPKGGPDGGQWVAEGGGSAGGEDAKEGKKKKTGMERFLELVHNSIEDEPSDAPLSGTSMYSFEDLGDLQPHDPRLDELTGRLMVEGADDIDFADEGVRTMRHYSGGWYESINTELRKKADNGTFAHVVSLDEQIANVAIPVNLTTYRGLSADRIEGLEVGDRILDRAYVSTSLRRKVAEDFGNSAASRGHGREPGIMKILVPRGSAAYPMNAMGASLHENEYEILLPRNTTMVVRAVDYENDTVTVEVVNGERSPPSKGPPF